MLFILFPLSLLILLSSSSHFQLSIDSTPLLFRLLHFLFHTGRNEENEREIEREREKEEERGNKLHIKIINISFQCNPKIFESKEIQEKKERKKKENEEERKGWDRKTYICVNIFTPFAADFFSTNTAHAFIFFHPMSWFTWILLREEVMEEQKDTEREREKRMEDWEGRKREGGREAEENPCHHRSNTFHSRGYERNKRGKVSIISSPFFLHSVCFVSSFRKNERKRKMEKRREDGGEKMGNKYESEIRFWIEKEK